MRARAPRPRFDEAEALLLLGASVVLLWTVGAALVGRLGVWGLAAAEVGAVLAPTLAFAALRGVSVRAALALGRPTVREVALGALAGAGGAYLVAAVVEAAQEWVVPLPEAVRAALRERIVPRTGARPLALDLAVLALLPALCEEALFRGALLGALRGAANVGRSRAAPAVALTALAFGLYHGSPYLVVPTATVGLLLGALVVRSGSLWPAVAAHAVNNTLAVLLTRAGHDTPPAITTPVGAALALASLVAVATALAARRSLAREPDGGLKSE